MESFEGVGRKCASPWFHNTWYHWILTSRVKVMPLRRILVFLGHVLILVSGHTRDRNRGWNVLRMMGTQGSKWVLTKCLETRSWSLEGIWGLEPRSPKGCRRRWRKGWDPEDLSLEGRKAQRWAHDRRIECPRDWKFEARTSKDQSLRGRRPETRRTYGPRDSEGITTRSKIEGPKFESTPEVREGQDFWSLFGLKARLEPSKVKTR